MITNPRAIQAAKKRKRILELRLSGMDFDQIADTVHGEKLASEAYTAAHAYRDLRIELAELRTLSEDTREEARQVEVKRLDVMLKKLWDEYETANISTSSKISGETQGPALWILDRILKIQERRAKYLGLDAPTKHEVKMDDSVLTGVVERLFAILQKHVASPDLLSLIATDLRGIDWSRPAVASLPVPALPPGDVDDDEPSSV